SYYTNILSLNCQLNPNISNNLNQKSLTNQQIEHIENVLKRNQHIQYIEQERICKLIDRLDKMKKNATGNGLSQCLLCSNKRGILSRSFFSCANCQKLVCDNCSIQTHFNQKIVSLCNICSENRQVTTFLFCLNTAWFFRSLPKPLNLTFDINSSSSFLSSQYIKTSDAQSISDQSSSDDDDSITDRFNKKLIPNDRRLNQFKQLNDNQDEINKCDDDDDKRIYSFKNNKLTSKEDSIDTYLSKCELAKSSKDSHIRLSPINKDYFEIFWKQSEYKLIIKLLRLENLRLNNQNQYSHIYLKLDLLPAIYKSTEIESCMIDETLVYDGNH
ncbi:unnamed protein product, partial [Rotaria sordida]